MHAVRQLACAAALAVAACADRADAPTAPPNDALFSHGSARGPHGPPGVPAARPPADPITFAPAALTLARGRAFPLANLDITIPGARIVGGHWILSTPPVWTSSDAAVVAIRGGALRALAVGTATITLTAEGSSGSLVVTVADSDDGATSGEPAGGASQGDTTSAGGSEAGEAPTSPTSPSSVPASAALAWPDQPAGLQPYDDQPWSGVPAPWYLISPAGLVGVTRSSSTIDAPISSGGALEYRFPRGFEGGVSPGIVYREAASFGREVFIAFDYKMSAGWQFHPVNDKLFYLVHGNQNSPCSGPFGRMAYALMVKTEGGFVHLMMNEEYYNTNRIQPNRGTTASQTVAPGAWHRVELYVKSSSAAFRPDGVIRIWTNGVLTHEYTDQPTPACDFYEAQFAPVWGGLGGVKLQDDYLWIDHTYVGRP